MKHDQEFDIAIVGNSLSARIAAALLAKNGQRILLVGNPVREEPGWSFSSVFIEYLLGALGGRSCFVAPSAFQVISPGSRVTIHSERPLANELKRELGATAGHQVETFLTGLQERGQRIDQMFWANQGLPWPGLKGRVRFRLLAIREKTAVAELNEPLHAMLTAFDGLSREFLKNLFQGLSLRHEKFLTMGEATLLWSQAVRPENLCEKEFNLLLKKRFEQFHGRAETLQSLEKLDFKGSGFIGGHISGKGHFKARSLLIGHLATTRHLFPEKGFKWPAAPEVCQYRTSNLRGQLSDLLAGQVIIGAATPLRLSICEEGDATIAAISSVERLQPQALQNILEPALPFASFLITATGSQVQSPPPEAMARLPIPGGLPPVLPLGRNVFCADSSLLFPGMGPAVGALLAWTLLNRLGAVPGRERNQASRRLSDYTG